MKKSKVIVTGGAGFIGSNLAEELAQRGNHVIVIDNLSTGNPENIQSITKAGQVDFIEGSITDLSLMQKSFSGVDYVFHQAALPSVPRSIEDPETTDSVNITGTLNVLIAARDNAVKKLVYASSSSVYGDTPTLPKTEDMIPNPLSPYAVTKLTGEYYCQVFTKIYNLKTVCLRYFNVYGPRQDPNSAYAAVIPLFINNVLSGKSPVIFGDGEQTRDFTFVKDVVEANIQAAESDVTGIFNLGNSQRVTINELTKLIRNIAKRSDVKPIYDKPRPGDIVHSLADTSKAKAFGYDPRYTLEQGLKETVEFFNKARAG
ncbi:MAG TPA: SDR family oxidoreductase [Dehalococcoidia bacterium]|nr:SDR family oxidoreductase [Dehalococcoidia bacterium]